MIDRTGSIEVPKSSVRRIGVLRALQLGDLLLAVPALRSLRAGFPDAEITLIGLPWAGQLAERLSGLIDRFVALPGYPGLRERPYSDGAVEAFLCREREYSYDLAVQMHGSGHSSDRLILDLGARITAGYFDGRRPDGLTLALPYPAHDHEIERNLGLARLLGCPERGTQLEFPVHSDDRLEAQRLLDNATVGGRLLVGVHAGARPSARRWPSERFAALLNEIARRYPSTIVLTGSVDETETALSVERNTSAQVINIAGKTTLGGLAAVLQSCSLVVANDTGPAHLAEAVGTATVRLFGPADPQRWAPMDDRHHRVVRHPVLCSPCPYTECPLDHRCMERISVQSVLDEVQRVMPVSTSPIDVLVAGGSAG